MVSMISIDDLFLLYYSKVENWWFERNTRCSTVNDTAVVIGLLSFLNIVARRFANDIDSAATDCCWAACVSFSNILSTHPYLSFYNWQLVIVWTLLVLHREGCRGRCIVPISEHSIYVGIAASSRKCLVCKWYIWCCCTSYCFNCSRVVELNGQCRRAIVHTKRSAQFKTELLNIRQWIQ